MKINVIVIAILAVVSFSSFKGEKSKESNTSATLFNLCGTVIDNQTGETLVGVEVLLEGTDQKTYSDFDGNFVFENISKGEYEVIAKIVSYKDSKKEDVKIASEKDEPLTIQMEQVD